MSRKHGATETFALLGLVGVIPFWANEPVADLLLAAGTTSIVGGLVGRTMWWLIVDSSDRWTTPTRGAIAGGLTGWISISPIAMVLFTLGEYSSITVFVNDLDSLNAILEFASGFVILGIVGTVGVGWITVPTAAVVGYILGRDTDAKDAS